jgi:hypothetical protein
MNFIAVAFAISPDAWARAAVQRETRQGGTKGEAIYSLHR